MIKKAVRKNRFFLRYRRRPSYTKRLNLALMQSIRRIKEDKRRYGIKKPNDKPRFIIRIF